jgi:hypothetical protein
LTQYGLRYAYDSCNPTTPPLPIVLAAAVEGAAPDEAVTTVTVLGARHDAGCRQALRDMSAVDQDGQLVAASAGDTASEGVESSTSTRDSRFNRKIHPAR